MITTGQRVTVFGGSGFIGRHVVRRLAEQRWVVRVAVRDPRQAHFLKPAGLVGQIVPMRVDLTGDESVVAAAVSGADVVINLVGILAERGRATFASVHAEGPARLARIAAAAGVSRFIHISAIGADPSSSSAYARSKAAGESGVRAAFPGATILRPSIVFGPEDSFFNRFACMARYLPALPLIGGGHTRFQPIYVADVADAILRTVQDPNAQGQTYELGGPRVYTFRQLMEVMLAEINRRRILLNIPFGLAKLQAAILERLPGALLTRDQVELLKRDNVVSGNLPGLRELGVTPTAVEVILPTYLDIYRRGGRYGARHAA